MCVAKKLRLVLNGPRPVTHRCSRRARPRPTAKQTQMKYTVVTVPSATRTRVLLSHGSDELLRAILPPPSAIRYQEAALALLQGLSLWLDEKLHVVLSVDEREAGSCLGLTDDHANGVPARRWSRACSRAALI